MAHPKSKISKQRRDKRRSHDFLQTPELGTCSQCGYYRDKLLIAPKGES